MSSRRVVVDAPTGASPSMPLQRHRASFKATRSSSSLDSPPASRTSAVGGLVRAPKVYVGTAPSGYTGGLGARVTRRALGISSVFLQGLRSSGLATAPAPGLETELSAVEDLGGCLVEYLAKVHTLEQISQELEAQLRRHLESKAGRSESWGTLRASWASSCQQVSARAHAQGLRRGSGRGCPPLPFHHLWELIIREQGGWGRGREQSGKRCEARGANHNLFPCHKHQWQQSR